MKKLKIAIVTDWLVKIGGAEKVLLDILQSLNSKQIYTSIYNPNLLEFKKYHIRTSWIQKIPYSYKIYKLFFYLMPSLFRNFNFDQYDIVLNSNWALSKCIQTNPQTMHICYMHNPTRYLWCDRKDYFESSMPKFLYKLLKPLLFRLRSQDFIASQNIDLIIANSRTVQQRIQKYYRKPSILLHPASHSQYQPLNKIQTGPYYVALGRLKGFKRFDLIIKTFNKLNKKLIIIGDGEQKTQLQKLIRNPNISITGHVSDKVRDAYLQHAKALIFPQEEDFGITILDALVNGCPVIAYNKGGAQEILTPQNGHFFNQQTPESLKQAITEFEQMDFHKTQIQASAKAYNQIDFQNKLKHIIHTEYAKYQQKYSN